MTTTAWAHLPNAAHIDNICMKDRLVLRAWIRSRASYRDVAQAERDGVVGNERFSPQVRRRYLLLWEWSAVLLSSDRQDRLYSWAGAQGVSRRIARARRIAQSFAQE